MKLLWRELLRTTASACDQCECCHLTTLITEKVTAKANGMNLGG